VICGGAGDDVLRGVGGSDTVLGEAGNDLLFAKDGRLDVVNGGPGHDVAYLDRGLDKTTSVEQKRYRSRRQHGRASCSSRAPA